MSDIWDKEENVEWIFQRKDRTYVLAKCTMWEAELATEVYAKGQTMVGPNDERRKDVPAFLGQQGMNIPQRDNLMRLIEEVSKRMVERLEGCEKVYLASLNESNRGLHFWLIPRKKEDKEFLGIDGFVLIAELRNHWVRREIQNKWDMPPKPQDGRGDLNARWQKYADEYKGKFQ
jgi:diadenosine tetraphosphate (Ap4A) HIT family hydrolase